MHSATVVFVFPLEYEDERDLISQANVYAAFLPAGTSVIISTKDYCAFKGEDSHYVPDPRD